MAEDLFDSTVTDTEFDVIDEMTNALDDMDSALKRAETEVVTEKVAYLRFLLKDLGDVLSGEYEDLRRRRFITKGTTK